MEKMRTYVQKLTYSLVDLEVLGHTAVNTHCLSFLEIRLSIFRRNALQKFVR